jgi:hypothetical protein
MAKKAGDFSPVFFLRAMVRHARSRLKQQIPHAPLRGSFARANEKEKAAPFRSE